MSRDTIRLPHDAYRLLQTLRAAGHSAYVVGGCVRDSLLGRLPGDWDICTSARPDEMKALFHDQRLILTGEKHVYAIGDILGPRRIMLAHMAVAEAHTAVHNILHPQDKKEQRYDVVPSAVFTSPEIGEVGLSEAQAREQGLAVRTAVFQFRELGKAQAMGALAGLFKIVAEEAPFSQNTTGSEKFSAARLRAPT